MTRGFREAIIFILPLGLFVIVFILFPILGTFWNSLWQDAPFIIRKFVVFGNYLRLFGDNQLWYALRFTLAFALVSVCLEMIFGMIIALVLNEKFPLRGLLRGVALIPWAIPSVIGARIWQLIYRYDYGVANFLLEKIGIGAMNWLGTPIGAFASLVIADVWRTTPFVAIILLAGLQIVPGDLTEQAQVDGAGLFKRFTRITLPMMKPIIVVAILFRFIDAMRLFDLVYVLTGGGPGGVTTSLSLHGYKFFLIGDFGYGSTISVFLFMITFLSALIVIRIGRLRAT